MANTCNGYPLLRAAIKLPRRGRWHMDVELAGTSGPTGTATTIIDGVTFVGSKLRGDTYGGRWKGRIVGGAGGLSKKLDAKNYAYFATVRHVVEDILREAGETLSSASDSSVLSVELGSWERFAGTAGKSLTDIAEKAGAVWRVLGDGSVWIGVDSYPAPTLAQYVVTDDDETTGVLEIAPTKPDLTPGVTLLDRRVEYVVHRLDPDMLRTEAYPTDPGAAIQDLTASSAVDAACLYPASVVAQNADGTLLLLPEDARIRGMGLANVPIRYALPGSRTEVLPGTRCRVGFDNGDLGKPFACLFDGGTSGTKLGSLLLVQTPAGAVSMTFFDAGVAGDAAAVTAQTAAVSAGNTAVIVALKPTVTA